MASSVVTTSLRALSPHFQRSINLVYDAEDADYIAGYIPTPNGANALAAVLDSTAPTANQRAHVWHAAYGSGKSLLGIVLSAFASRNAYCQEAISIVQSRLTKRYPDQAKRINDYLNNDTRLLPVILSGDEGSFSLALTKALARALDQHEVSHLRPRTQFEAALNVINLWEASYPDAYQQLQLKLNSENLSLANLTGSLLALDREALTTFERLYPEITAGAKFDYNAGLSLENIFRATSESLHDYGYRGILVIWDEFGRFLDSRIGEAFGSEAALLQSFAEFCNRSESTQVHLVLITHQLITGYATGLPTLHQQEWARIAERFRTHGISSDPNVMYRLIAEAIETPNPEAWQEFTETHRSSFDQLTAFSFDLSLFDELDDAVLRQHIIEQAWPLHPLSVYALPRLASRVAQNERTLFTFLASEEPGTLVEQLEQRNNTSSWWIMGLEAIWNYFAEAIRADARPGGMHPIWSGTMYALGKVDPNDSITHSLIKTLAVLLIVSEANIQSHGTVGKVLPTNETLAWALGISKEDVAKHLETLTQRRAVVYRKSDGYWTFTRGSDIDLDTQLSAALERRSPNRQQIRQVLENYVPLPYHLPRGYNQERSITRFFTGFYCWPGDIKNISAETFLKQLGEYGYADGAIAYVIATNASEREEAIDAVNTLPDSRIVYVIPDQPLLIVETVRELFALDDLSNDPVFMQQDERLPREMTFFVEDARDRLRKALNPLFNPSLSKATWWRYENSAWQGKHYKTQAISRLLSELCDQWFGKTPILNNELVNQQNPSGQQERALEKVIDALLAYPQNALPPGLGLEGHGPDWLIVRTLLSRTGLLQLDQIGNGLLTKPLNNPPLADVWDAIQGFASTAVEQEQEISGLLELLQSPPFGLRRGVLPLLLATALRSHLPVITIKQSRRIISPITGQIFIEMCKQPEQYTIELGPWDIRRSILWAVLKERLDSFISEQEQMQQPLNVLSAGLLRWLQSLPRYCRDTNEISPAAQKLRTLIRKAQREPSQVLSYELLELLDSSKSKQFDESACRQMFTENLSCLMDEISTAYQTLLYFLDHWVRETFSVNASDGHTALYIWLEALEKQNNGKSLGTFRFSDKLAEQLVEIARQDGSNQRGFFGDRLSKAVLGIALSDWNDQSKENFKQTLLKAKLRVEQEIFDLAADEAAVQLSVSLPDQDAQTYRFRQSGLSPQGQRILQNFKSTLEIAGRPLSLDEKRQIVLALMDYVMGGSNHND